MANRPEDILRDYAAWERRADKHDYQWKLRLLQSHWRTEKELPMKYDGDKARGAELPIPAAKQTLDNYLTRTIRRVVRREVEGPKRRDKLGYEKLYKQPRIYNHLLSSQPLCFNLFGELAEDLNVASQVLGDMSKGRVSRVTAIEFEWSPGRGDYRYTGDKSAFDVYIAYQNATGQCGVLGIEVKYHENLTADTTDAYRPRYDEVAAEMGCFHTEHLATLRQAGPLQQMWRDHLLVGAHRQVDGFADACFVVLYPEVNTPCAQAVAAYRQCLSDARTFEAWTLETFVSRLRKHTDADWVQLFYDHYLDLSRLPL